MGVVLLSVYMKNINNIYVWHLNCCCFEVSWKCYQLSSGGVSPLLPRFH